MSSVNVFGTPVTQGSRQQRARTALNNPNVGNKRNNAIAYVRGEKQQFGNGVSTLCIFYNATGDTLVYVDQHSSLGHVYGAYPARVENGQWGAYLHVKDWTIATGSVGFVVYRVADTDTDTVYCKQLLVWQTPWGQVRFNNQVYCDVFIDSAVIRPDEIYRTMDMIDRRQHTVRKMGMFTSTMIETGTSPMYEAKLTLISVTKTTSEEVEASSSELVVEDVEDESKKLIEDVKDASEKTSEDVEDASKKTSEDVEA